MVCAFRGLCTLLRYIAFVVYINITLYCIYRALCVATAWRFGYYRELFCLYLPRHSAAYRFLPLAVPLVLPVLYPLYPFALFPTAFVVICIEHCVMEDAGQWTLTWDRTFILLRCKMAKNVVCGVTLRWRVVALFFLHCHFIYCHTTTPHLPFLHWFQTFTAHFAHLHCIVPLPPHTRLLHAPVYCPLSKFFMAFLATFCFPRFVCSFVYFLPHYPSYCVPPPPAFALSSPTPQNKTALPAIYTFCLCTFGFLLWFVDFDWTGWIWHFSCHFVNAFCYMPLDVVLYAALLFVPFPYLLPIAVAIQFGSTRI